MSLPDIAAEILGMAADDQRVRKNGPDSAVDRRNTLRMKEIIGFDGVADPFESRRAAEQMAWLLVQHADLNPSFQKYWFALM